jgi:hypothetical protein
MTRSPCLTPCPTPSRYSFLFVAIAGFGQRVLPKQGDAIFLNGVQMSVDDNGTLPLPVAGFVTSNPTSTILVPAYSYGFIVLDNGGDFAACQVGSGRGAGLRLRLGARVAPSDGRAYGGAHWALIRADQSAHAASLKHAAPHRPAHGATHQRDPVQVRAVQAAYQPRRRRLRRCRHQPDVDGGHVCCWRCALLPRCLFGELR